ncbi:spermidine synthase [Paenibacillus faecalis]|uniref:spermidine synthase n=1 Tax=Paenibacillus faecalis TaxID=2079532 RepID=UPI000D0F1296|nr:fused MFS/spermidine synthase [Paenibacillus faecalis]
MHLLYKNFDHNQEITIFDTTELYGESGNFRLLQFSNEAVQGALDLDHPKRIVFEYPRAIIHLIELNDPAFEDLFLIGHGIGTIPGYYANKRVKVAELDGRIVELSKQYFGYSQDNVIVAEGRQTLESEKPESYDYIVTDAFNDKGTPRHLTSIDFFKITFDKLDDQGSIILNLLGRSEHDYHICSIHTTLRECYPYVKAFALSAEAAVDIRNILLVGSKHPVQFQTRHMCGFVEIELGEGYIIQDIKEAPRKI